MAFTYPRKLRRRIRIWWLSITTPDSPISTTLERAPYSGISFIFECPQCETHHQFRRDFERNPAVSQTLSSAAMDIFNRGSHIELQCYVCGLDTKTYYTTFAKNVTDTFPTHRLRITDTDEE